VADDETTDRIDYPAEFLAKCRVELGQICTRLDQLAERLPWADVAERRSLLFRVAEWLEVGSDSLGDAAAVTRHHVGALSTYLASR
jgi:hypothetical protein